ncbi:tyramine oxidase subunit B [Cytobacillus firmus]|nr:tyramine oxidase subunit B [Cytobacillus firmus]
MLTTDLQTKVEFLYLSEEDMIQAGVLDMKKCVKVIDDMFKVVGKGDYLMGGPNENEHGIMLWFPEEKRTDKMPIAGPDRRFMSLISYLGGDFHICGEKWYGSNIANREKGLPRSILTVTLNDVESGQPLAYMSGNLISAMRTGAVPGVAAKYLAKPNSEVVGVVGAGVINKACLSAIAETQGSLKEVKIFDINEERCNQFANEMTAELSIKVSPVTSMQECIEGSDIISVATSGHSKPEIKDEWVKEGCLITLTGTAELSEEFYLNNTIVADNWKMHQAWGRDGLEHPQGIDSILSWAPTGKVIKLVHDERINEKSILNLGDIALGKVSGRKTDAEKIVFVTGGLPVEDIAWGYSVYQSAKENNIGQVLKLWDKPHWA